MRIIAEGHTYALDMKTVREDDPKEVFFQFYRGPAGEPNELFGTTNEEVLRMLIDRIRFLNGIVPCRENSLVITKLEEAFMWLEHRTNDRLLRGVEGKNEV